MKISDWLRKEQFVELSQSEDAKVIVFAAKWCGYCSMFLGTARELKPSTDAKIYLVDADDPDESLWDDYKLRLVPTISIFRSGNQLFRKDGMPGVGLRPMDLEAALSFLSRIPRSGEDRN